MPNNIRIKPVAKSKNNNLPDGDKLIRLYILNGLTNAKQAAIDAGYSPRSAEQSASRVLRSDKAKRLIEKYTSTQLESYIWSKQDKLKRLEKLIESCSKPDEEKGALNAAAAISAIKEHNLMQGDNMPTVEVAEKGDIIINFVDAVKPSDN